jgi:hypothetical protein
MRSSGYIQILYFLACNVYKFMKYVIIIARNSINPHKDSVPEKKPETKI